jgi:hypothetical protein
MDAGVGGLHQSFVSAVQKKYCPEDLADSGTSESTLINKPAVIYCHKLFHQNSGKVQYSYPELSRQVR